MSIDSLEIALEQARESEPADDGFTEIVMQGIRGGTRGRHRRFLTRPAILAAAAVLATGGALAAAVRTTTHDPAHRSAATPAMSAEPVRRSVPPDPANPVSPRTGVSQPGRTIAQTPSAPASAPVVRHFTNAFLEWGYTSAHTAYVLDKRSGLRIVTDTRATTVAARRVHDVTLTVTNTTKDAVAVSSQSGCALSVAAWAGRVPDPSNAAVTTRDPSTAKYWECAGGGTANHVVADEFVLAPGASLKQTAKLTLARGQWVIAGVCRCTVVSAAGPHDGMTLNGLQQIVITTQDASTPSRLTTPPLAVKAL